jgi:hypothetical protein
MKNKNLGVPLSDQDMKSVLGGYANESGGNGCAVTCGEGYFACCRRNIMVAYCTCKTNGSSSNSCDSGGAGASQCSVEMGFLSEP